MINGSLSCVMWVVCVHDDELAYTKVTCTYEYGTQGVSKKGKFLQ